MQKCDRMPELHMLYKRKLLVSYCEAKSSILLHRCRWWAAERYNIWYLYLCRLINQTRYSFVIDTVWSICDDRVSQVIISPCCIALSSDSRPDQHCTSSPRPTATVSQSQWVSHSFQLATRIGTTNSLVRLLVCRKCCDSDCDKKMTSGMWDGDDSWLEEPTGWKGKLLSGTK